MASRAHRHLSRPSTNCSKLSDEHYLDITTSSIPSYSCHGAHLDSITAIGPHLLGGAWGPSPLRTVEQTAPCSRPRGGRRVTTAPWCSQRAPLPCRLSW